MLGSLEDFCVQIDGSTSSDEAWVVADRFCRDAGFDWTMYGFGANAPMPNGDMAFGGSWSSYPPDWMRYYLERGYPDVDDSVRHCAECGPNLNPYPIGVDLSSLVCDPRSIQVTMETAEFGMRSGVVLPMRWSDRRVFAGFGLASRLPGTEFTKMLTEHGAGIRLAVTYAHTRIQLLRDGEPVSHSVSLTAQERACLQYSAGGLFGEAIAERLGSTPKAVSHHLEHARRKLKAANTTHAVTLAILLRLIDV